LPPDVQSVDFPSCGSKGKRVVIPSTVKCVVGVRVGVPEFEIEGKGVALTAVMDIMRNCQPDVLYLPEGIVAPAPVNYNVVEFFPEKLIVVCPETCEISVSYSFGYTRETTTLGGIFGGQIVYPKREKCSSSLYKEWLSHGLKAFNDNLRKYFGKDIKSGTITGFVEDGDLEGLYKRKGFFARLFGKK